jgi:hypothetical protein
MEKSSPSIYRDLHGLGLENHSGQFIEAVEVIMADRTNEATEIVKFT